jgi:two-component system, chemotaxis family, sensor kinase CheA
LKNIFDAAGYVVETAIDGLEGFTKLKSAYFDLLVSDIEMPRMNGFELTINVRNEKKLAELPIVLVTSRSTRADKEKGIDAGANAYIVKNDFDQNNLLDVVDSLL